MPRSLNHIHGKKLDNGQPLGPRRVVEFNRKLEYRGHIIKANELAATITPEIRKPIQRGNQRQWYFTCSLRIPDVKHKVRIVILWQEQKDDHPRIILVTNRVYWEVSRIVRAYGYRWTGTETFHRDGKQELGMGECQLRDNQGQTRHMYLVMLGVQSPNDSVGSRARRMSGRTNG